MSSPQSPHQLWTYHLPISPSLKARIANLQAILHNRIFKHNQMLIEMPAFQTQQLREAQLEWLKHKIHYETPSTELCEFIKKTKISTNTVRNALRYAHNALATAHSDVIELEHLMNASGFSGMHGYGRGLEDWDAMPRAQHVGDEHWTSNTATHKELVHECQQASQEMRVMRGVEVNLRDCYQSLLWGEEMEKEGKVHVVSFSPTDKDYVAPAARRGGRGNGGNRGGRNGHVGKGHGGKVQNHRSPPVNRGPVDNRRSHRSPPETPTKAAGSTTGKRFSVEPTVIKTAGTTGKRLSVQPNSVNCKEEVW